MYFEALLLDTYDYLVSFRRNWLFFFGHKMTFINSVVGYEIVTEMISVVPHRNPIILFMCKLSFFFFSTFWLFVRLVFLFWVFYLGYVSTLHVCLMLMDSRRWHQIPWNWARDDCKLPRGCWEAKLHSLHGQRSALHCWASLQPHINVLLNHLLFGTLLQLPYET